jgi:hypothetical protein
VVQLQGGFRVLALEPGLGTRIAQGVTEPGIVSDGATATKRERVVEEGTGTETALRRGNGAAKQVPGSPRACAPFTFLAGSIVEPIPESPVPKPWFGRRRPLYGPVEMLVWRRPWHQWKFP